MSIKMIATDLDYTLLKTGGKLSPRTEEVLSEVRRRGILLVPATGRDVCEMEDFLPVLSPDYLVNVNGAVVREGGSRSVLRKFLPPQEPLLEKLQLALSMGIYTEVYCDGIYTDPYSYENMAALGMAPDQLPLFKATRTVVPDLYETIRELGAAEKLHVLFRDVNDKKKRETPFLHHSDFAYTAAYVNNLELCCKGVDKAAGLKVLAEHLRLDRQEVMAIGDGANDACMLRWAGLGVAVENAVEAARRAADVITASNDADGAALAIEKYCFKE